MASKKSDSPKPNKPANQDNDLVPMHKRLAMGQNPNTGAGGAGGVRNKP